MARSALIAIGGHALVRSGQRGTIQEQLVNAKAIARRIAQFVNQGWNIILTHGNGPQVGAALLRSERAASEVYTLPLDVCVASSQSEIGYLLQLGLEKELREAGVRIPVMTILTQVEVDRDDKAFEHPSKPIGPFYSRATAEQKKHDLGWDICEDSARGYRRVVPSPAPRRIVEMEIIRQLHSMGILVIALGGGGIPVAKDGSSSMSGVEAVIDKDRSSALLASGLGLDAFIITTDVDHVYTGYKTPQQKKICRTTSADLRRHYREGHFPAGSMGPKIESALYFLEHGGKEVIITTCDLLPEAMSGNAGTHIVP
ncbi:MAG: carbamate kinase [Bacteroidota bacterium]